ncbi:MAG TPA: hypothetical protein VD970_10880 [Acetobacteraceae bacterium]|nr:hypothetical protein [Acetobacteraceae bacterium]
MPRRHAAAETWHLYQHPRLGTRIAYPDRFTRDPSHDDPDGARFTSSDDAFFLVYGMPNRAGHDLAGLLNFALGSMGPGRRITYRAQGRSWFVLSGFQDDQILYERHLLSPDRSIAHAFVMVYPAALRRPYDPIVTRMSRSFGAA